ncbi:MAG: flap endonuclease-1 [Candidatus Micrarchaeia archaeon]
MAVNLGKLVWKRKFDFDELKGRLIAIDAYNIMFQFLSVIRQADGMPLSDAHGNITSHLSGLFYRNIELIGYGAVPVYVFDGIPSMLKQKTIEARMNRRNEAYDAWKTAIAEGKVEEARLYAQASTRITKEIVASAKQLLEYMGIAYINAPSEGEAQASEMCKSGLAYAVVSQDYDTMLLGAPRVLRNLTISGKRKLPKKNIFINIEPELMDFEETLKSLSINHRQLIWLGILLGTDFNDGIKGVGPKTALKIVKNASKIEDIEEYIKSKYHVEFEIDPKEVEQMFLNPEVKKISREDIEKEKRVPNKEKILSFMCDEHGFDRDRIMKYIDKLLSLSNESRQKGLSNWFKQ